MKLTAQPLSPVTVSGPPADPFAGSQVLRITYDYLFVYAVEPPGDPASWMRVVQQQYGTVDFGRWDYTGSSFEPWISDGNRRGRNPRSPWASCGPGIPGRAWSRPARCSMGAFLLE